MRGYDPLRQMHLTRAPQRLPRAVRRSMVCAVDNYTRWTFKTSQERNEKYRELKETCKAAGVTLVGLVKYSDASGWIVAMPRGA